MRRCELQTWVLVLKNAGNAWLIVVTYYANAGVGEGPLCRERESREQGDGWCAGGVGVDITVLCINHGLGIRPVSLSRNSNKSHRDSNNTSHQLQTILEISTLACCHTHFR